MLIWISGASSGLGFFLAEELRRRGDSLITGARSFENGSMEDGICRLRLDITDDKSIQEFVGNAAKFGKPDILINAAGAMRFSALQDIPYEELQGVLDVNLFGTLKMTRAFLKIRQEGKGLESEKTGGLVVNFSSINGLLSIPYQGAYSISKHAIEAMTEAMQAENPDTRFMLVEPGDHRGGSEKSRVFCKNVSERHRKAMQIATDRIRKDENSGSSPERFARKLAGAIHRRRPPLRLRIASLDQHLAVILHDLLPSRLFSKIIRSYYSK